MKNLAIATTAQHHWLKLWTRARADATFFIITADLMHAYTISNTRHNLCRLNRILILITGQIIICDLCLAECHQLQYYNMALAWKTLKIEFFVLAKWVNY